MVLTHIANRPGTLLTFLRRELGLSSSLVKRLKWQNAFWVDGTPAHTDFPVQPGSTITVLLDEPQPEYPPEDGALEILYEDESLLAVDKPAGLLMHPSFYRNTGTLANRIAGYYARTSQPCAVHPVSRLDRDTFGVVLLAKNAHIHAKMMELLQSHAIQKTYEALAFGHLDGSGCWTWPIARRGGGSLLREVRPDGQMAETHWQALRQFDRCTHLRLNPITGRTHQLRVHCAQAGHPILGDAQYGSPESAALSEELNLPHQQLCAVALTFPHPMTGEVVTVESRRSIYFP